MRVLFFYSFILFSIYSNGQSGRNISKIDSLIQLSKDHSIPFNDRMHYAKSSLELAEQLKANSLILKARKNLSLLSFEVDDYDAFKSLNRTNLELASRLKDSLEIASAYQNIAQSYYYENINDSAYFYYSKAIKIYDKLSSEESKAYILMTISDIQETEKDYISSEENAIAALKLFETFPKSQYNLQQLYMLNNLLGIISLKLGHYDESLEYHNRAESINADINNGFFNEIYTINNKAFVYRKQNNYDKALELYQGLVDIKDEYNDADPTFFPLVIDNLAYTKFVANHSDHEAIENLFKKAYRISDSIDDDLTKLPISIDLSKFYLQQKKSDSALKYVNISYKIAKETSSNEILLDALKVLSKLKEGEEGKAYLNEYIRLSDSLLNVERNVRNKFARIELETEELEEENEKISQQRMWLLIISAALLGTFLFLYIILTQRAKNKELQFEKDQQKANEEIYNLMLSQQDKVDEARANEKKRISEELHDGILGRLFGTRLSLDSLNFSEGKEAINNRATYIKELMSIENDIRKVSHDLNTDFVSGSGFMDIVSELIEKQTAAYQLKSSFNYTDDINWEGVPNKTKINIYRIIQESLQNIYKHANANDVKISIQLKNNVICLSIVDDGDGFDVNKSKKGIGLKNINSRVKEVNGKADFNSTLKEGTEVSITIPYKN
ncbi:tetratricopeptide repeat-containing sensor histidine kinase [Psychroserpens algicola]|uniref:tetratricopeptide repeat-containing sensor histidine kinase n=1 Tax=Psychroserpens algicola TaxID=1719034 RepID=UPI0019545579|nr:ATP-binding protein [Psychroserpens algicola]